MADALSELFTSLATEADIQRLIDDKTFEGLHFEFKRKRDRTKPDLEPEDSWEFSRALSGFANSDGGILLWGVGSSNENGLDYASSREPVRDHTIFVARLRKALLEAVVPMVDGVEIDPVPGADTRFGYAKVLVPRSELTPHRGMLANREYYKRSPEGFHRLEHFDLEDMFGRRPLPRLSLGWRIIAGGSSGGGGQEQFRGFVVLTITNGGRGSARAPYLAFRISAPYGLAPGGINGDGREGLARQTTSDPRRFVFTSGDVVVHPEVSHEVTGIVVQVEVQRGRNVILPGDLTVAYELTSENARLVVGEIVISGHDIAVGILPPQLQEFIPQRR